MRSNKIISVLGKIMIIEGMFMIPSVLISVFKDNIETTKAFLITILILEIIGLILSKSKSSNETIFMKDGIIIVGLSWIIISIFGALPLTFACNIKYIDALFEIVSGFTTTGASVIADVEALPVSILYWRSFTNWLGGMGVLVFFLALPKMLKSGEGSAVHLLQAESPGPTVGKLVPKLSGTANILYKIYIGLTVLEFIILIMLKMPAFDALVNSFSTAGTGGFSIKNNGIGAYTYAQQNVIAVFMFLFGINFNVYFFILAKKVSNVIKNTEFWTYIGIFSIAVLAVTFNIKNVCENAFHNSFFTISSMMTSTGFSIIDYDQWPSLSKTIIILLMIIGASAGSTCGGIKVSRLILLIKNIKQGLRKYINPNIVAPVHFDGKIVEDSVNTLLATYLGLYILLLFGSTLVLSIGNYDCLTCFSASLASLSNTGPAFSLVGPTCNYAFLPSYAKILLSFDMLAGRLEIIPLVIILFPKLRKGF